MGGGRGPAVGTEFDVYLRANDLRVTVSDGPVKVGTAPVSVISAGHKVDIALRLPSCAPCRRGLARLFGVAKRLAVLREQPLGEVIEELEPLYGAADDCDYELCAGCRWEARFKRIPKALNRCYPCFRMAWCETSPR